MASSHLSPEMRTKDPTLSLESFQSSKGQTFLTNNSVRLNEAGLTGAAKAGREGFLEEEEEHPGRVLTTSRRNCQGPIREEAEPP